MSYWLPLEVFSVMTVQDFSLNYCVVIVVVDVDPLPLFLLCVLPTLPTTSSHEASTLRMFPPTQSTAPLTTTPTSRKHRVSCELLYVSVWQYLAQANV